MNENTLKDHQGNLTATVCGNNVEQELSYDAWGNLRSPETWCVDTTIRPMFDRGYTGHEHLIGFRLINMNGRMYDPVMSSFLSVDRYVQQPETSQGFNRYAYCMYNPLKYVDPSGWRQSLPNGHGIAPPPDGDETGYYITGVYTDTGFNYEYDCYTYSYGLNEVTVTPYGNSWAGQRCKELIWDHNGGGHSAEYDGGEVNVPILSGGGGGGGYYSSNSWNTKSIIHGGFQLTGFTISTTNCISGCKTYKSINEDYTRLGKNLSKAQKAKLASKYPKLLPKGASAAKYGKAVARELEKTGKTLGYIGLGIEALDVLLSGEIHASNIYNGVIGAVCIFSGPVGWIIGGVALAGDIISCAYTGRTIGGNIDRLFDDKSCRLWDGVY